MSVCRILQFEFGSAYAGTEAVIINLYRHIDRSRFQFDFLVDHKFDAVEYEAEVEMLGGHVYRQYYRVTERHLTGYISPDKFWQLHPEIRGGIHLNLNSYGVCNVQLASAAKRLGLPIRVIHAHNCGTYTIARTTMHKFVQLYAPSYGDKLLACSGAAGRWLYNRRPFVLFPNAIDVDKFAFRESVRRRMREQYGLGDKLVIGFVGRFVPQKNPEFLLQILHEINRRCNHAHLVLIGDGELEEKLRCSAAKMGLDNLSFMGHVGNVHEWMQTFDIFLLPSRFEGLGLVLIEAQASGLACFASDRVPPEAAVTQRFSYLSLKDPGAWAEAILDADLSYDRSRGRAEVAAAGYDIRVSAKRLEEIYDELLSKR